MDVRAMASYRSPAAARRQSGLARRAPGRVPLSKAGAQGHEQNGASRIAGCGAPSWVTWEAVGGHQLYTLGDA
eukprot:9479882-Pyramimonas_sp.AAC.1